MGFVDDPLMRGSKSVLPVRSRSACIVTISVMSVLTLPTTVLEWMKQRLQSFLQRIRKISPISLRISVFQMYTNDYSMNMVSATDYHLSVKSENLQPQPLRFLINTAKKIRNKTSYRGDTETCINF